MIKRAHSPATPVTIRNLAFTSHRRTDFPPFKAATPPVSKLLGWSCVLQAPPQWHLNRESTAQHLCYSHSGAIMWWRNRITAGSDTQISDQFSPNPRWQLSVADSLSWSSGRECRDHHQDTYSLNAAYLLPQLSKSAASWGISQQAHQAGSPRLPRMVRRLTAPWLTPQGVHGR